MERLARFVVRHRRLVLFVAVLLLIPSLLGAIGTYINYLPSKIMINRVDLFAAWKNCKTGILLRYVILYTHSKIL